jgi:hypothetical protein
VKLRTKLNLSLMCFFAGGAVGMMLPGVLKFGAGLLAGVVAGILSDIWGGKEAAT